MKAHDEQIANLMSTGDFGGWVVSSEPKVVRLEVHTNGLRGIKRDKLLMQDGFHLMDNAGSTLTRFLPGLLHSKLAGELLQNLPEDGIYGKHRDYRALLDWSSKSADLQKRMIDALEGVMPVLLRRFEEFQIEELNWLRSKVDKDDLVFGFGTTLIKITGHEGEGGERFHAAHVDAKNLSGTSVVVVLGDFQGADVVFPDLDVAFSPKHGDVYMFRADRVRHVVRPVDYGDRCVLIFYTHATSVYSCLQ